MIEYKGFKIIKGSRELLYSIIKEGKGGSIPHVLSGSYTTPTFAMKDIDTYVAHRGSKKNETTETNTD
jgi:hypothetical protein